jgi:hypothetical protein
VSVRYCNAVVIRETRVDPAELCEEEAEEGSDYCARHDPENEPEPDRDPLDWRYDS